jgi:hypothetical protein
LPAHWIDILSKYRANCRSPDRSGSSLPDFGFSPLFPFELFAALRA